MVVKDEIKITRPIRPGRHQHALCLHPWQGGLNHSFFDKTEVVDSLDTKIGARIQHLQLSHCAVKPKLDGIHQANFNMPNFYYSNWRTCLVMEHTGCLASAYSYLPAEP